VITTAAVPGKKAPILITAEMANALHAGLGDRRYGRRARGQLRTDAARRNRRPSRHQHPGTVEFASSSVPFHASQMFGANVTAFLKLLIKEGELQRGSEDEIIRETLVTHGKKWYTARARAMGQPRFPPEEGSMTWELTNSICGSSCWPLSWASS
jgi:NAD(P) transhydrogenase subunit alpha